MEVQLVTGAVDHSTCIRSSATSTWNTRGDRQRKTCITLADSVESSGRFHVEHYSDLLCVSPSSQGPDGRGETAAYLTNTSRANSFGHVPRGTLCPIFTFRATHSTSTTTSRRSTRVFHVEHDAVGMVSPAVSHPQECPANPPRKPGLDSPQCHGLPLPRSAFAAVSLSPRFLLG